MKRKIIGVLGLGIFGTTLAQELTTLDQDVIAADNKPRHVEEVADQVTKAAIGDITDFDFLKNLGVGECDVVIIATGSNLESSVMAVIHCKKLGVPQIICKSKNESYEEVLYAIGADSVISPEKETAKQLVSTILRNKIHDIFHFEGDTSIIEFEIPEKWVGKSILELDLRKKYHMNIIGMREKHEDPINTQLSLNQALVPKTLIVAIADTRMFEKYDYLDYLN